VIKIYNDSFFIALAYTYASLLLIIDRIENFITPTLTAGCDATQYPNVHPILGVLSLVFAALTTISLFLFRE